MESKSALRPRTSNRWLAQLIDAGESDQFASVLAADSPEAARRRSLQLKQLLFGMGETFRTLLQKKVAGK